MDIQKRTKFILALISFLFASLFFYWGWIYSYFPLLFIYISLVLLGDYFFIEIKIPSIYRLLIIVFFLFIQNCLINRWLLHDYASGIIFLGFINAIQFGGTIFLFNIIGKRFNYFYSFIFSISTWVFLDFIQYKWELGCPHQTLGNGLAAWPLIIQWYEYTGVLGGTLWIVAVNLYLFLLFKRILTKKNTLRFTVGILIILLVPIVFSIYIYNRVNYEENSTFEVIIIHPNVFDRNRDDLIDFYKSAIKTNVQPSTDYIVMPEAALLKPIRIDSMTSNPFIQMLNDNFTKYPNVKIIVGCILVEEVEYEGKRKMVKKYNAAVQLGNKKIYFHTKQKLVPGLEALLHTPALTPFNNLIDRRKCGNFNLIKEEYGHIFTNELNSSCCSAICYELIFGSLIAKSVQKGASFINIINNEKVNMGSPAIKFAVDVSRIRAIENRRTIVKCSNLGISCFIDPRGMVTEYTNSKISTSISENIYLNKKITFYTLYGDYLGIIAMSINIGLLILIFIRISPKLRLYNV